MYIYMYIHMFLSGRSGFKGGPWQNKESCATSERHESEHGWQRLDEHAWMGGAKLILDSASPSDRPYPPAGCQNFRRGWCTGWLGASTREDNVSAGGGQARELIIRSTDYKLHLTDL